MRQCGPLAIVEQQLEVEYPNMTTIQENHITLIGNMKR